MKTILLIDDCIDYREVTAQLLGEAGHDVWEAQCPKEALDFLKMEKFDLIVCDLHMPLDIENTSEEHLVSYEVGVRTIQELKELCPGVPIICMSNTSPNDLRKISKFLDPIPAYTKPFHGEQVMEIIDSHLSAGAAYGLIQ